MLSIANVVQSNSGSFDAGSGSATLPVGTIAGNTLVLAITTGNNVAITTPSGFVRDSPAPGAAQQIGIYRRSNVPAAETSWTITLASTAQCAWAVYELEGIDLTIPVEAVAPYVANSDWPTQVTGNTPRGSAYDVLIVAALGAYNSTSATAPTWSGHSPASFVEQHDQGSAGASTSCGLSVAFRFASLPAVFSCSATNSLAAAGPGAGVAVVYAAADAVREFDVDMIAGFEQGTAAGLNVGFTNLAYLRNISGTPAITASTPRSGSYCLELSAAAAAEYVQWTSPMLTATTAKVVHQAVRFVGAVPTADTELLLLSRTAMADPAVRVRFRAASGKIGVQVNTGTEQLSATTVTADVWYVIEISADATTTTHTADWSLDSVAQTQATGSGPAGLSYSEVLLGWVTAATATIRYDDTVVLNKGYNYGKGPYKVVLLPVDPAGTLTLSGTAANFKTFTANGTLAAWDATVAKAAISEGPPPMIGSAADGFAQVTIATSNYVEIPITTYPGVDGAVRAVRMLVCGWAADANFANIGLKGWDGVAEVALFTGSDSGFDASTTAPAWMCKLFKPSNGWTQAKVDALAFRVGFSYDATPDCGIHWIAAEALVQLAQVHRVITAEEAFFVDARLDPATSGALSYLVTTPADRGATFDVTIAGVPSSTYVAAGATYEQVAQAVDYDTVSYVGLSPDPA